jgi:prepilin-type N-terminal cleavage/methylation domain-containing protein
MSFKLGKNGFTMAELMIALGVGSIVTLFSLNIFQQKAQTERAGEIDRDMNSAMTSLEVALSNRDTFRATFIDKAYEAGVGLPVVINAPNPEGIFTYNSISGTRDRVNKFNLNEKYGGQRSRIYWGPIRLVQIVPLADDLNDNVQGLEDYSRPAMLVIEVNISPFNPLDPTERTTLLGGKGVRTKTLKLTAAINRNNQITDFVSSNNARNVSLAQACAQLPGLGGTGGNEGVWDPGWDNAGLGAAFLPPEDARCLAFVGEGTLVPPIGPNTDYTACTTGLVFANFNGAPDARVSLRAGAGRCRHTFFDNLCHSFDRSQAGPNQLTNSFTGNPVAPIDPAFGGAGYDDNEATPWPERCVGAKETICVSLGREWHDGRCFEPCMVDGTPCGPDSPNNKPCGQCCNWPDEPCSGSVMTTEPASGFHFCGENRCAGVSGGCQQSFIAPGGCSGVGSSMTCTLNPPATWGAPSCP